MIVRKCTSLLDLIRDSTLLRLSPRAIAGTGAELWAQLDLTLPGGMKDRVALRMLEDAEAAGLLTPGGVIVESSSGTMAEGLARVGALKGYSVVIVSDPRLDDVARARLLALGARLEIVKQYDTNGGWQSSRLRRLHQVIANTPRAFWPRQYDNPSNPGAYTEVARALSSELPNLSALVVPVGSGGSISGVGRTLRETIPGIRIVAVDTVGSVLFNQPDGRRLQSGNGNSLIPGNIDYDIIDEVHWIADGEAFSACRELARTNGVFAGGTSGAAYIVASWIASRFDASRQVAVMLPDRGDRYVDTIYSDQFIHDSGLTGRHAAEEPQRIRYGIDVAMHWSFSELPRERMAYHHPSVPTTSDVAPRVLVDAAVF